MSGFETNVPQLTIGDTGAIAPEPSDIFDGVLNDYDSAFGGGMSKVLSTPQGQIAQSETAIISDKNDFCVELINKINPSTSSGVIQDAIGKIYLIDRIPGRATLVSCVCGGVVGTTIPLGARAKSTTNHTLISTDTAVIGAGGTVTVNFQVSEYGPIDIPIAAVNKISVQIPGWDTVINNTAGILGRNAETPREFELRRRASVAKNANGSLPAIRSNVLEVENVLDVYTEENDTSIDETKRGVLLIPHSLYVCVLGGSEDDIAKAIWHRKGTGCDYNGSTSVVVTDEEGYDPPYPEYTVKFQRPFSIALEFEVDIIQTSQTPANVTDLVKAAIVSAFTEPGNRTSARIGAILAATDYIPYIFMAGAVAGSNTGPIQVNTIQIRRTGGIFGSSAEFDIDEYPTLSADDISVTVN